MWSLDTLCSKRHALHLLGHGWIIVVVIFDFRLLCCSWSSFLSFLFLKWDGINFLLTSFVYAKIKWIAYKKIVYKSGSSCDITCFHGNGKFGAHHLFMFFLPLCIRCFKSTIFCPSWVFSSKQGTTPRFFL
jgi:hypothetical protein